MSLSKRRVIAVWAAVFSLGFIWSLLIPLRGQSDESAHAAHAAAVVRGQALLSGEVVTEKEAKVKSRRIEVWVPANYSEANGGVSCLLWRPDAAESCTLPIPASNGKEASVFTPAANYPPLYYAAVGWPSLFLDGAPAWYGMRILTAFFCSLAVAGGIVSLARAYGMRTALATLVAFTPTSLSFFGTINPQGPEIALAFATACLVAPVACGHRPSNARLLWLGAVAGLLALIRPSSALWAVIIGLVFAICIRPAMWKHLLRRVAFYACLSIVTLACTAALVWNRVAKPGENTLGWPEPDMSFSKMMDKLSAAAGSYRDQAFGNFGWESNPVPSGFGWAFVAVLALLAVGGLAAGNAQQRIAVAIGVIVVPASTILMQFVMLPQAGIMWQGRYNLPLIAAVAVLCTVVMCSRWGEWASALLLFAFAYFTLIWALRTSHRYATGLNVSYGLGKVPFDHIVALLLAIACAVALGVLYWQGRSLTYAPRYLDAALSAGRGGKGEAGGTEGAGGASGSVARGGSATRGGSAARGGAMALSGAGATARTATARTKRAGDAREVGASAGASDAGERPSPWPKRGRTKAATGAHETSAAAGAAPTDVHGASARERLDRNAGADNAHAGGDDDASAGPGPADEAGASDGVGDAGASPGPDSETNLPTGGRADAGGERRQTAGTAGSGESSARNRARRNWQRLSNRRKG